jgi:hypothetical protein
MVTALIDGQGAKPFGAWIPVVLIVSSAKASCSPRPSAAIAPGSWVAQIVSRVLIRNS